MPTAAACRYSARASGRRFYARPEAPPAQRRRRQPATMVKTEKTIAGLIRSDQSPARRPRIAFAEMQHVDTIKHAGASCNVGTGRLGLDSSRAGTWRGVLMPYFNFDLIVGEEFKYQGGMILEDKDIAIDKADSLA